MHYCIHFVKVWIVSYIIQAYISYKVVSTVAAQGYRAGQHEVIRRFRDFTWLKNRLRSQYKGSIVPALPEKSVLEKYKMTADFIEARQAALAVFLNRVASHPDLSNSPDLRLFLQSDETEFAIESSRAAAETGGAAPAATGGAANAARKTLSGAAKFLRSLSQNTGFGASTGATMGLPSIQPPRDDEESADYLKARSYFWELEGHLAEAHRQAERLVRHHGTLATALSDFSGAMAALGRTQDDNTEEAGFTELASQANAVADVCRRSSENLAKSFEAPMKEFMRSVRAAKKAMLERSDALAARNAARADVEARRARLTRLRSTPGMKEERVKEAERELDDSLRRSEAAARAYSAIVHRLDADLIRFQRERARDIGLVLKEFAVAEAAATAEMARLWGNAS